MHPACSSLRSPEWAASSSVHCTKNRSTTGYSTIPDIDPDRHPEYYRIVTNTSNFSIIAMILPESVLIYDRPQEGKKKELPALASRSGS